MALTVFLLGLVYVAFVAVLVALLDSATAVVAIVAVLLWAQFWFSDRIALYAMGGRLVTPEQEPRLHGALDRLCATANMSKPRVAVADIDMPNAFATGCGRRRAVVCVTTGLLRRLTPDELDGVLAHELSHIAHRDVVVMTTASFLGVLAGLVARFTMYSSLFGGGRDRRGDGVFPVVLAVLLVSAAVYAISYLLIRALSRYRELAADRAAAELTGAPSALAAALTAISGEITRIPSRDLRAEQLFNAFFVVPALGAGAGPPALLSTHPTLEQRLDQLARLAIELEA